MVLAAAPFGGCAASPPQLFVLSAQAPSRTATFAGIIAVDPVGIPGYLDRAGIVRRSRPHELQVSPSERWGDGMREMITRVLVNNLQQRLPSSQVFAAAGPISGKPDLVVELAIARFDADPDGAVVLMADWAIRSGDIPGNADRAAFRINPAGPETSAMVAAMNDALGQLADKVVATLRRTGVTFRRVVARAAP